MGRVTALSRAVTTNTRMNHGSHEPDVDESRLEQAGPWYQCLSSKQTGSACGVPLVAWNQMWGPEQRRRALERAPRPSGHKPGTCCAHIYRPGAQGRSIMGNNVKNWLLLPILTCYCLFLPIIDFPDNGSPAR